MDIDRRLSSGSSEIAHPLVTELPIQSILAHLVLRVVEVLPIRSGRCPRPPLGEEARRPCAHDDHDVRRPRSPAGGDDELHLPRGHASAILCLALPVGPPSLPGDPAVQPAMGPKGPKGPGATTG
ncbi:MAG: hypothetical protein ACXWBN_20245 [Acidimicrobiales bacterium]